MGFGVVMAALVPSAYVFLGKAVQTALRQAFWRQPSQARRSARRRGKEALGESPLFEPRSAFEQESCPSIHGQEPEDEPPASGEDLCR